MHGQGDGRGGLLGASPDWVQRWMVLAQQRKKEIPHMQHEQAGQAGVHAPAGDCLAAPARPPPPAHVAGCEDSGGGDERSGAARADEANGRVGV